MLVSFNMNIREINNELVNILKVESNSFLLTKGNSDVKFLNDWIVKKKIVTTNKKITKQEDKNESIFQKIEKCNKCGEIKTKKNGFGSGFNSVMLILNAPKQIQNFELNNLKKEMLLLLKKMVAAIDIELTECYTTNLVKCELVDPTVKPSIMVNNCLENIMLEIEYYKPSTIIVMGDILPLQKIVHSSSNINWYRIDHPIALTRNPFLKRGAWNTLLEIKKNIEN